MQLGCTAWTDRLVRKGTINIIVFGAGRLQCMLGPSRGPQWQYRRRAAHLQGAGERDGAVVAQLVLAQQQALQRGAALQEGGQRLRARLRHLVQRQVELLRCRCERVLSKSCTQIACLHLQACCQSPNTLSTYSTCHSLQLTSSCFQVHAQLATAASHPRLATANVQDVWHEASEVPACFAVQNRSGVGTVSHTAHTLTLLAICAHLQAVGARRQTLYHSRNAIVAERSVAEVQRLQPGVAAQHL
jgi:hypothetical protein